MTWNPPRPVPPMGWYPTPRDELRWWDGRSWTGMRVRGGRPGVDWATTDQPGVALSLGFVFLTIGLAQLSLGFGLSASSGAGGWPSSSPWAAMLLPSALWFAIAIQGFSVRRVPPPASAPAFPDAVRPLPGEQEGYGAGWYPMTLRVSRWWTGARWAPYVGTRFGVRPSFHGARAYRIFRGTAWTLLAIGALCVCGGAFWLAAPFGMGWTTIGVVAVAVGAVFCLLGALFLALSPAQRRVLLPPEAPPRLA